MSDAVDTLVFDSSVLSCFARAGRLELLHRMVAGRRCVVTRDVLEELAAGTSDHLRLADVGTQAWLEAVTLSELAEIELFAAYSRIFGAGPRDLGEAATLAWAEAHGATAMLDDQTAVNAARAHGVTARRTLALVADAVRREILDEAAAAALVDELIGGGARFPCAGTDFIAWARGRGAL